MRDCAFIEKNCFSVPWSESELEKVASNDSAIYFVAEEDGRAIGYGGLFFVLDEGSINNIAVLPEYRRRGIASSILVALTEESKEKALTALFLEVRESNLGARELYASFGFVEVGRRRGFYSHPAEDALTMKKSL